MADDAWGLGTTIYWLLTGREDYVPGAQVQSTWGGDEVDIDYESPAPAHGNREQSQTREDGAPTCAGTVCSALPDLLSLDPGRRETALAMAARHAQLVHTRTFGSPSSSPGGNPPFLTAASSPNKGTGSSPPRLRKGRRAASSSASEAIAFPCSLPWTPAALKRNDGREEEPATATAEEAEATAVVGGSETSQGGHGPEPAGGVEGGMAGAGDGKEAAVMATASNGATEEEEDGVEHSPSNKSVGVGERSPTGKRTPSTQEPKIGDETKSVAVGTSPTTSPRATSNMVGTSTSSPRARSPKSKGTQLGSQDPTGSGPGIIGQRDPDPAGHSSPPREARDGRSRGSNNDTEVVPGGGGIFEDGLEGSAGHPAKDELEETLSVFPLGEAGRVEGGGGNHSLGGTQVDFPAGMSSGDEAGGKGTGNGRESASFRRSEDAGSFAKDGNVVAPRRHRVAGGSGGDAGPPDGSGDLRSRNNKNKKKNRVAPIDLVNTKTRPPAEEASIVAGREGASTATACSNGDGGGINFAKNVRRSSSGSTLLGSTNAAAQKKRHSADAGVQCSRPAESSDQLVGQVARGGCGCTVM
ncbi:hypothetical protein Esi_0128_0038 [Ectocarpus siliculosus]|uniref:Protein kinase domain-containing protein n=1 Tax=Ectocarpus siliculosus TaxID=2880 RepID=D8LDX9_ECTSI|nr:hypothetical protein Esi_0128_0038 [Ectocarpus siliculosus]|eukprot:CBN75555.1 hypothetical protein Esi_0128_0038 [Ectocarpus siliculosus]